MSSNKSRFETYYAKEDSGRVVYEERKNGLEEIQQLLELIDEVKKAPDVSEAIIPALEELNYKIEALRYSDISLPELKQKLKGYSRVPLGDGKFLHLSSFLTSKGEQKVVKSEDEYLSQVKKMRVNTMANLTNLLLFKEEDEHLRAFFDELKEMESNSSYQDIKTRMDHLTMSGIIKHYNQVKFEFLQNWLKPFEEQLGKAVQSMSPKEVQTALGKVENLKKKELEQVGMRLNAEIADQFRPYNREMHELMNGTSSDFWGFPEYRDEFVNLVKKIINRFTFKLENHYLVFQSADQTLAYLVGFPDDTFGSKKKIKGGKVGLVPHLKIFFNSGDGSFKELRKEDMEKPTEYYRTLKTAVVPFLGSLSMIVNAELSQGFKDSFDMWI